MERFADELTRYLADRAGENLRCVVRFTAGDYDVAYVREDIEEGRLVRRVEEVHENITAAGERRDPVQRRELGEVRATLQIRGEAVVIHFPGADDQGVLVGLEPEAASQLEMFVSECLELL